MERVRVFEAPEHKITRFHFEIPMGVRHINLYVVEYLKTGRAFLVDTGPKDKKVYRNLLSLLEEEGYPLETLDALILTHEHLDHGGGAGSLQEQYPELRIIMHPNAYDMMTLTEMKDNPLLDYQRSFAQAGVPTLWNTFIRFFYKRFFKKFFSPLEPETIELVEKGPLEEFGVNLLHLPGHSDSHLGIEVGPYLICGDVLWEGKTPNPFFSNGNPHLGVQAYLDTMDVIKERASRYEMVLPAHGEPITEIVEYTEFIHDHHHRRWERLRETLDGPKTAWQVLLDSGIVRGSRRVHPAHLMLATSEVLGHLEWAEDNDWVNSEEVDGLRYFFI